MIFIQYLIVCIWSFYSIFLIASPPSETPINHQEMIDVNEIDQPRPWVSPDFSGQESALGYNAETFSIPSGLEDQVSFWFDIYTKYYTYQGVLHDSENISFVYRVIDFSSIENNSNLSDTMKQKQKRKMLNEAKKEVKNILSELHQVKDHSQLTGESLRIWSLFENMSEKNKFSKASQPGRLRFQLGLKDRMEKALFFSGRYKEKMEAYFRSQNLPIELIRLIYVESSFNVFARSRRGASGLWQIMPRTARRHLKRNSSVDYRNHPWESTVFAAKMLKDNYSMLKDWPIAITGYNYGPYGMKNFVRRYNTKNLVELIQNAKSRRFGFASKNFYATFLAALEAEKRATEFFPGLQWATPFKTIEVELPKSFWFKDLVKLFDGNELKAETYNPHISKLSRVNRQKISAGVKVYFPEENKAIWDGFLSVNEDEKVKSNHSLASFSDDGGITYTVSQGDTLIGIAKEYGVSVDDLMLINDLQRANFIRAGQKITIPVKD